MGNIARLRAFIQSFTRLVETAGDDEKRIFADGRKLLSELITHDDWLPDAFAQPDPERYQQYLLYCDPLERFSVVSFVWGPGQKTPVHDHTVWGIVGVMRGREACEEFASEPATGRVRSKGTHELRPGGIDLVSPRVGDIHRVSNALADRPSVSIHVYGGNIGAVKRHVYEPDTAHSKPFVSGYSSAVLPNLWDRSAETAAAVNA
jgi:predicted metal-dependent enzyme (double-stranded beta helix superfamily)